MKKISSFIIFLFISTFAFATHEIAGQITSKCLGGYTYEISVTTYTKGSGSPADRCSILINFGDGDSAIVCRSNYETGDPISDPWGAVGCTGNPNCSTHHMGEWTAGNPTLQSLNIKKNVYTITHTYPGPCVFIISAKDPNFEDVLINLPPQQAMVLLDSLVISPWTVLCNNSPVYAHIPIDTAALYLPFIYNPEAIDPDGDSLSYSLIPPPGTTGYVHPTATNSFGINAVTGDVSWNNPDAIGKYIFCILIDEWRKQPSGQNMWVGTSMQIVRVLVLPALGINESDRSHIQIKTYPNPSTSELSLTVTGISDVRNCNLEIFDYTGRKIKNITLAETQISFEVSQFLNGIYYCRLVKSGHPSIQGKFEVLH